MTLRSPTLEACLQRPIAAGPPVRPPAPPPPLPRFMCIVISLEMGDSVEGNKNDDAGILSAENEESLQIEKPMLGMVFHDKNELQAFYSNYAREEGFDVKTRSSNM